MRVYRFLWMAACAVLAAVGVTVTFVVSAGMLLFLFLLFALVGAILAPLVARDFWDRSPHGRTGVVLTSAAGWGTAAGGFAGLGVILGPGVILCVLLGVLSSPWAVEACRRGVVPAPAPFVGRREASPPVCSPSRPEHAAIQPLSELSLLTDEQLCLGWRASYLALQRQPSSPETGQGTDVSRILDRVRDRQRYLDEFERRNASGLAAWLGSGARAAGNPLPYLVKGRAAHPAIDWDELTSQQDR